MYIQTQPREAEKAKPIMDLANEFEGLCKEDRILVFFERLLDEWKLDLDGKTEPEKRTAKGKAMVATFSQCARYIHPLFELCRNKVLPDDICEALLVIVECCMKRDYLAATEQYIRLSIGDARWPMGVTMAGIHESSAREKIRPNSVGVPHTMDAERTRRYLQSIKRLMALCERHYPAQP